MKNFVLWMTFTIGSILSAQASDQFSLIGGVGMNDALIQSKDIRSTTVLGLAFQKDLNKQWRLPILGNGHFYLSGEYYHLEGSDEGIDYELNIIAFKPLARFYWDEDKQGSWFYEAAFGLSYFDEKNYEGIRLSTDLQFSMHGGIGWHISDNSELIMRYNHFSNGYTRSPNHGLDFFSIAYTFGF